jgi:hypothetical protein
MYHIIVPDILLCDISRCVKLFNNTILSGMDLTIDKIRHVGF